MSRSDDELIAESLDHLAALRRHMDRGDLNDETVVDAVALRLSAAIEAVAATSDAFRERVFGDVWNHMWSTRNRIAHGYACIELTIIRATVEQDVPEFERRLHNARSA